MCACAAPCPTLSTARVSSRRCWKGAASPTARYPPPSRSGPFPWISSGRARATTSSIPSRLAEAGYPRGFSTVMDFHNFGSTALVDAMQLVVKDFKDVGIEVKLNQKEYGAFISSTAVGNYEGIYFGPATPFLEPDSYLYTLYYPGHPRNIARINDPALTEMLVRQRRLRDPARRRALVHDIQRLISAQQYLIEAYSFVLIFAWDSALKNYGPNLGYDYGGRLLSA